MMPAADVLRVLERLAAVEIATWLDGGWGVDALLGRQTRAHDDLDLVVALDQSAAVEHALAPLGYALTSDERPTRFVLAAGADGRIDLHPVVFDTEGGGLQRLPDGTTFRYPPAGFGGVGTIAGHPVRCLTPKVQLLCHLGYPPDEQDRQDMRLLSDRFGLVLPPPYDHD